MFFQVLSSILFLPFLVMSMIIAQVHLEGYWDSKITKWRGRQWSVFYIIFFIHSSRNMYHGTNATKFEHYGFYLCYPHHNDFKK